MPRSGEDARRRLQQAALELFGERGYEATTTAGIAAKAGVTERTFFRHFPDKREALFDGEDAFRTSLSDGVLAAPEDVNPMAALLCGFRAVERVLEDNRSFSGPREAVIAQTPALQERMRTKTAGLINALSEALRRRGVDQGVATLAAQVGMAARLRGKRMVCNPTPGLDAHLTRAFDDLHDLSSTIGKSDLNGG